MRAPSAGGSERLLLLDGADSYAKEEALRALVAERLSGEDRELNLEFHDPSEPAFTAAAVIQGARQLGMFSPARVVVVREAHRLREPRHERTRRVLEEGLRSLPASTAVIFVTGAEEESTRRPAGGPLGEPLSAAVRERGQIRTFAPLKADALALRLRREAEAAGKRMEPAASALLAQRAGPDLGHALTELNKVISFTGDRNTITQEDVAPLVPGDVEESIFALLNHVAAGNRRQAVEALRRLLDGGEPPARILPMIERTLRQLIQAKFLRDQGVRPAASRDNLPGALRDRLPLEGDLYATAAQGWMRERLWDQSARLSWSQLTLAVDALAIADAGAKGWEAGPQDPELAVELLIVRLCSRA